MNGGELDPGFATNLPHTLGMEQSMALKDRILAKIFTAFPSLVRRAAEKIPPLKIEGIPWAPFTKGLKGSRVAIVTTAGVHLKSQKPFNMKDPNGDATFRVIPKDTKKEDFIITHDYYDHRDADIDINIVFPIDRLRELADEGFIGAVAENHYGFMGHIDGPHLKTLLNDTAPDAAKRLKEDGVDCVLLTPG